MFFKKTQFNLKDSDGNSTLGSLGDLASVKTISGSNYLCFLLKYLIVQKQFYQMLHIQKMGIRPFRSSLKTMLMKEFQS